VEDLRENALTSVSNPLFLFASLSNLTFFNAQQDKTQNKISVGSIVFEQDCGAKLVTGNGIQSSVVNSFFLSYFSIFNPSLYIFFGVDSIAC
jgi:hypothetical protein